MHFLDLKKIRYVTSYVVFKSLTHKITTTDFSNDAHFPKRIVTIVGTKYSVWAYVFLICEILEKVLKAFYLIAIIIYFV
jgi:hypothetical protein